jgi:hypothetical protein
VDVFDEDAFVVRRSLRILGASATVVILGAAVAGSVGFVALGLWIAWVGIGALAYGWARSPGAVPLAVRARADALGLSVDGVLTLPASRIVGGWVQPRPHASPVVHVRGLGGGHVRLVVRDVDQGRALLQALAIDASHVSADYWAMARPLGEPRAFAHVALLLALSIAVGVIVGPAVPPVFAVALVALIVLFAGVAIPTRVVVGGDGVLLRWLGTARFVPWRRVTDVEPFDGGVMLSLGAPAGDEEWLTLRMPEEHQRYHPERDAMVERMVAALRSYASEASHASHGQVAHPEPLARLLGRAGGRTREWVRTMRALVRPVTGFRVSSVPVDRLWHVVEDPSADREARTGAAIALAPTLHEGGQARLRAVADGCAEPRLRIALATAAAEARASDEALAEALDAAENEGGDDGRLATS